jgi:hypothetical protein
MEMSLNMGKTFKVVCNWDFDFKICQRFVQNYITNENHKDLFITYGDNYDYLAVFNSYDKNKIRCAKENVFGFIMEPSWTNSWDRNIGTYCSKVFFHDLWLLPKDIPFIENFVSSPSLMFYHMNGILIEHLLKQTINKIKTMSYIVSKSQITDDKVRLYSARRELANKILESNLPIDIYGNGWESDSHDKRIKGSIADKSAGLIDYKYSIAIENCCERNYLTEKFIDCLLLDTTPVYFGCPNADEIYDAQCFIPLQLHSDNVIEQLGQIIDGAEKDYKKRVDILTKMKLYYYSKYNIYEILKGLI